MEKPILATNMDGFLIKHSAFIEPHKEWFDKAISLTKDVSLAEWKGRKDYFTGVDIAMKKIMPSASDEERTKQAREWYQEAVIEYIKEHKEVVNKKLADLLIRLKSKFYLALITTNTKEHISQILQAGELDGIYDSVFASSVSEKPDKASLFERFKQEYGTPKIYLASRSKEAFEECKKLGALCIYFAPDEIDSEIQPIAY